MPRPKKPAAETRSCVIHFRLTQGELAQLQSEAAAAGVAANDCARLKTIGGRPVLALRARPEPPGLAELRQELTRIGVNLNQIARRLHMTGEHEPDELKAVCADLDEIFRRLLSDVA